MDCTTLELQGLQSITNSDFYECGRNSIVWDFSVYDVCTIPKRSRAGVYSSLVQKGLVRITQAEKKYVLDKDGNKTLNRYWERGGLNFGTIAITTEGYAFLDSAGLIDTYGHFTTSI